MGSRYAPSCNLQHQPSAKQLINRYESIGSPRTGRHRASPPPRTPPRQETPMKKDKSPLRQSFQNIVTAFKKGARAIGSRHDSESPVLPLVSGGPPSRRVDTISLYNADLSGQPSRPPTPPPKAPCLSGKLLHLFSASSTEPMNPVWRPCTATMGLTSISLSHPQASNRPSSYGVSLLQCIEVRSSHFDCKYLDRSSIGTSHVEDLRAFELIYDGKPTERFACFSTQERAMWIDTVWDAIISLHGSTRKMNTLLGQGDRDQEFQPMDAVQPISHLPQGDRAQESQRMDIVHPISNLPPPLPSKNSNHGGPRPVSQASTVSNHRLLPPLVIANGCPSLSTSSATTSSDSQLRSRSPSIANLDSLSVVKQRLAQIQSPTKDTGMPLTAFSRLPSPQKLQLLKPDGVTPLSAYDANNTIIDYYGGQESDQDQYSGDVVSITAQAQDILRRQDYGPAVNVEVSRGNNDCDAAFQISGLPPPSMQTKDMAVQGSQPQPTANNASSSHRLLEAINSKLEVLSNQPSERDAQSSKLLLSLRELALQFDSSRREQAAKLDNILTATPSVAPPIMNTSAILNKLDMLIETQRNTVDQMEGPTKHAQLEQLVGLLRADIADRASQIHQQADSVRYLNELNLWLEAFVSNGTTQIQGLAANVEALCQSMGCSPADVRGSPYDGLREDIHRFILETRSRDESVATLHNNMMALLHEQRQGNVNAPHDIIAGIMHQQKRDHEAMLSTLIHEVSSEIRGERLRFVEAMKEATQINVQMHVDQFKRELNKEVVTMTKEVQRLHNEKKAMENQIAELFSFYSKRAPAEINPGRHSFAR